MRAFFALLLIFQITFYTFAQNEFLSASTIKIEDGDTPEMIIEKAANVLPAKNQIDALRNEFIAFVHFGPNTFSGKEWGDGMEDPKIFNLKKLDTDQWCRAIKDAGMKMVILTVKHHDGFVIWQSRYTNHGIMSTNFEDGNGDVLRDLSQSCKKYNLKLGVYLSPADLYQIEHPQGLYGNGSAKTLRVIPREIEGRGFENKTKFEFVVDDYNEYFLNQLFELLTEYGEIHEVWFDGAHPKTKGGQTYNYHAWKKLIRTLAPKAVIFGKEDVRWCGNEGGATRNDEWNVIPYSYNPHTAVHFPDMVEQDLASQEKLFKAKYLHYQQAETNTSIREGWFYRDDHRQKVRSADDVFDIYERAVGGNSTFLLNIPPNRDGEFSPKDVAVLQEVGKRIKETYHTNLLANAKGPNEVLDGNPQTFLLLNADNKEIIIELDRKQKINRIVLQEAIATHSERVEKHAIDALIDGEWKEVATASNIGYKRILRFPDVSTNKIRLRILQCRKEPAIQAVLAHYYKAKPPQLNFERDINGFVKILSKTADFSWNKNLQNLDNSQSLEYQIYYSTDGSEPDKNSMPYKADIFVENRLLKAVAYSNGERGETKSQDFGLVKKNWKLFSVSSEKNDKNAVCAFDADEKTYWQADENSKDHSIAIDFGKKEKISAITYTPQCENSEGMIAKADILISKNGKKWQKIESFNFGNLINDPTPRTHYFKKSVVTKYIKLEVKEVAGNSKTAIIAELDFLY